MNAKAWCKGRTDSRLSRGSINRNAKILSAFARKFPWLSITPLGVPVVPEV